MSPSNSTWQYRAAARDVGEERGDYGPWTDDVSAAADEAHRMCFCFKPPYDEVYVERRSVGEPHRHLTIRHPEKAA